MRVIAGVDDDTPCLQAVVDAFSARGIAIETVPTGSWPSVALQVAEAVSEGKADMGVLMCWTGTGTSIMANKVFGIRAALCWEPWIAEGARRWNDANVLVMSLKRTGPEAAREIVDSWLNVLAPDPDELENIHRISEYENRNGPKAIR